MGVYLESIARAESRGSKSREEMSGVSMSEQEIRKLQMAGGGGERESQSKRQAPIIRATHKRGLLFVSRGQWSRN